jgi:hypothetical protein
MKSTGSFSSAKITQLRQRLAASGLTPWLWVALGYLLLTLINLGPVVLHLGTQLAGDNSTSSDVLESVWGIWWWRHALLDLHQWPLQISALNYPDGLYFPLYPLMAQAYVFALPLAALTSPVFTYNVLLLLSLVASGLAGYALCREISGDALASFVGGLIWAFFPAKMISAVAGHLALVFLFAVPLAALGLMSTLKSPTRAKSLLTSLALILAGTIHPTYLVYVLVPMVAAVLLSALSTEGRAFWRRDRLQALLAITVLTALPLALLALPLAQQLLRGNQAVWTSSPDVVGFSPDALGFLVPSVDNPLVRSTPLAPFALKVMPYQYSFLIYAGWLPLLLAFIGGWTQRAKSRPWVVLAIGGAILALGPLLKIGGDYARVPIAGEAYRVVMPYAFIMNWPFIQWSRTPGRLTVLVMLAVSVLATLGLQRLLKRLPQGRWTLLVVGVIAAATTMEYWVRFPFPSFSAAVPASVTALRAATEAQAVLQVPINGYQDNERALYWQTVHQHALVGGRVYRDEADASQQYAFYRQLLLGTDPQIRLDQRLSAFTSAGIGWVLYDAAADPTGEVGALLKTRLGAPQAEDGGSALYKLTAPPLAVGSLLWQRGANWEANGVDASPRRFCQRGEIGVMAASATTTRLTLAMLPAPEPRRLTIRLNHQVVGGYVVGDEASLQTGPLALRPGFNQLEIVDEGSLTPAAGASASSTECTAAGEPIGKATWGPALSDPQFDASDLSAVVPVATFGSALQLVHFSADRQAHPGEAITLHMVWQATEPLNEDLTVFAHVLDANHQLVAQMDAPPLGDAYPTSRWQPGEGVATRLTLTLPAGFPTGDYQLALGVYRQSDLQRLEITDAVASDNELGVGQLSVVP